MKENTGAINAQVPVDVATFLLNEKRMDLQSIETRHRVSVMLIPNVRLETPNYTVTRMRHDDLNKTEPLPASYNLVEAPAEEETKKTQAKTAEAAPPRPEAAVRGITPQQPAPVPVAREARPEPSRQPSPAAAEEGSIIGKIFGFFKRKPAAAAPAADPVRPVQDRGGPRRGRHERGERDGGRRDQQDRGTQQGGQRHRQDQDRQRDGGRHRHEQNRQERHGEQPRHQGRQDGGQGQRPQQHAQQHQRGSVPHENNRPPQGQQPPREHGEQREGRGRRRRRGGRDRHEHRQGEGGGQQPNRPQHAQRDHQRPADGFPSTSLADAERAHHAAATAAAEPAENFNSPAYETPAAPPSFERETVRDFQPQEQVASPPASGPGYAPAEPLKIEWPSDLQQVESDPEKIRAVQQQAPQQPATPRPKRVRPPVAQVSDEPLVQIETDKSGVEKSGAGEKTPV